MSFLPGIGGFIVDDASPTYLNSTAGTSGAGTCTFAFDPDDQADTIIVCAVCNDNNASSTNLTGVTFNGNALTLVGALSKGTNSTNEAEVGIYKGTIPKGSGSANVVITASATVNRGIGGIAIAVKNGGTALTNAQSAVPSAGAFAPAITTTRPALIIACCSGGTSISGVSCADLANELLDIAVGSGWRFAVYWGYELAPVTAKTYTMQSVTASFGGSSVVALAR